ncbi:MAG: 3-dehydroquinate synthase [Lentisphaerae bacterium]|nr:3-dehydroquinate synthase [Lentisphaerota bacterium]
MSDQVATRCDDVYHQRFTVTFDYPVHFTRGVFSQQNGTLRRVIGPRGDASANRIWVCIDSGLARAWPDLAQTAEAYVRSQADSLVQAGPPVILPGGEAAKEGWGAVHDTLALIGRLRLDRHSCVIGVGGGAMLDMLGLAVSLAHRGLRFVRIPTTTLAQCDAGIGVKNGIDDNGTKNFAGTFAPPFGVIADFDFLRTLAPRDWIGGLAEAFKVAMIRDAPFFDYLCDHARAVAARDAATLEVVIRRCAALHLDQIRQGGDPFETGSARPLDFGHWSAHQIECMSHYRIGHGQAVAIGLAIDAHIAMQTGLVADGDFARLVTGLTDGGLPLWDSCIEARNASGELLLLAGLERFREHLGGELNITLPVGIGAKREVHVLDAGHIETAIHALRIPS